LAGSYAEARSQLDLQPPAEARLAAWLQPQAAALRRAWSFVAAGAGGALPGAGSRGDLRRRRLLVSRLQSFPRVAQE